MRTYPTNDCEESETTNTYTHWCVWGDEQSKFLVDVERFKKWHLRGWIAILLNQNHSVSLISPYLPLLPQLSISYDRVIWRSLADIIRWTAYLGIDYRSMSVSRSSNTVIKNKQFVYRQDFRDITQVSWESVTYTKNNKRQATRLVDSSESFYEPRPTHLTHRRSTFVVQDPRQFVSSETPYEGQRASEGPLQSGSEFLHRPI